MTLHRLLASLALALALVTPAFARERILLVGDSWGYYFSVYESFESALDVWGFPDVETVDVSYGGSTAAQWATTPWLNKIDAALAAHPTIDVVHVLLGINDVAWNAFSLLQKSADDRDAILDGVGAKLAIVVRHVLDQHPGVEIVLGDYDYVNFVDFPSSSIPIPWRDQNAANWVLGELNRRKEALAATDARIHHVNALGLMQVIYGDPKRGIPPQSVPWPGGFPFMPGPKVAFADRAHLSQDGYWWLAWLHVAMFYKGYFAAHP